MQRLKRPFKTKYMEEQGKEPKFKVGDKARVVGNTQAPFVNHLFKIGTPVTILKRYKEDYSYRCGNSNGFIQFRVHESDLTPIEEQTNLVAEGSNVILCDGIPRRIRVDLMGISEKMIQETIWEIEKIGADVRLTNAQNLLSQAKDLVSDFIDEQLTKELPVQECDASKADSSTFSPDNNSEKTMTSKDHSRLKEGEKDNLGFDIEKLDFTNVTERVKDAWLFLTDDSMPEEKLIGKAAFYHEVGAIMESAIQATLKKVEPKEQVSNTDWKPAFYKWCAMEGKSPHPISIAVYLEEEVVEPLELQLREANKSISYASVEYSKLFTEKEHLKSENQRLRNLLAEAGKTQ